VVLVDHGILGKGTHKVLVHAREDTVAPGKPHHPRANGVDDAGEFVAHHDRQRVLADDPQRAGARLVIDGVKAGSVNADEEFTSAGRRLRHVGQRRVLRSAVA
jgi:hypothetical protein